MESQHEDTLGSEPTIGASIDIGETRPTPGEVSKGESIGRYVVLDRVGSGGMGVVYTAYDPDLDRRIALKVLHGRKPDGGDSASRDRLQREAQAMAQLSHPNVITVHDVGQHGGRVFIAMEYVDGSTLTEAVVDGALAWRERVDFFVQAGSTWPRPSSGLPTPVTLRRITS